MNALVPIVLFGWIPVVLVLFCLLPTRRAIITAFIAGWLFLPVATFEIQGVPNFSKASVTSLAVVLGIVLFDVGRLGAFRWRWCDLPIALWLLVPLASSLSNGRGVYDGISGVVDSAILWGVPYLAGRLYLNNIRALRELAVGIVIGGMAYVPLCLFEIRMSPQLHTMVYGFHQHVFAQTMRFGGWRPTVFLEHGLAVGMWMTGATLLAMWLWRTRATRHIANLPMSLIVTVMFTTTILCKSVGAIGLLGIGTAGLLMTRWSRSAKIMLVILAIAPGYLTARIVFNWEGRELVDLATLIEPDRAKSLQVRLDNEDRITEHALQRPLVGWTRWGEYRAVDDGGARVVTDSLWIVALGQTGLIGLTSMVATLLLPAVIFMRRTRLRNWHRPSLAPVAGVATLLMLFMIDSMLNSMLNPVYLLGGGGLISLTRSQMGSALRKTAVAP